MSVTRRVLLAGAGVFALLIIIGALAPDQPATHTGDPVAGRVGIHTLNPTTPAPAETTSAPAATATPTATGTPTATATPTPAAATETSSTTSPVVRTATDVQTESIPFSTTRVNDASLPKGQTKVRTAGVNGVRTVTYRVTYTDGVETARTQISSVVTRQPVTKVIAVGTKVAAQCDPNYTPCVPIASDVDCLGGTGDGPAYVQGPVYVIGTDIYHLDSDHDGIGCE